MGGALSFIGPIFSAISSFAGMFGGGGGGGGYTPSFGGFQQPPAPPTMAPDNSAAQAAAEKARLEALRAKGLSSTIKTTGSGLLDENVASQKKTLLGS